MTKAEWNRPHRLAKRGVALLVLACWSLTALLPFILLGFVIQGAEKLAAGLRWFGEWLDETRPVAALGRVFDGQMNRLHQWCAR